MTHEEFEKQLWFANCFIIPLIVYPIVSLFGHLVIAIQRDEYADTYDKIRDYLKGKADLNQPEEGAEVLLNDDDLDNIQKIFNRYLCTEASGHRITHSRLRNDCFYQALQVHKKNEAESSETLFYF